MELVKISPEQRQIIFEEYMKKVDHIAEECDWVTHIEPETLVNLVLNVVEEQIKLRIQEKHKP